MKQGLVSIIIPFYNSEKYLKSTVLSVFAQSYSEWELFLVDDRSTDNSKNIAQRFVAEDKRVNLLSTTQNMGKAEAINLALKHIKGQYVAFLDSDDIWMPEKLERQIAFMQKGGYPISCTAYIQTDEAGEKSGRVFHALEKVDYKRLLLDCPVGNSTVIYDVSQIGIWTVPNIKKRSDDALWLQILKKTPYIWGLNEVLMKYRLRESSLSTNKISLIKYHWILYTKIEKMNVFSSMFHIIYWCLIKIIGVK